ncbi:MAG TPA: EAL domain-containing protein, partial [Gammaproteobacteria bacterium]
LSLRQFHHRGLVGSVQKALRDSKLPPSALELEVTESILMEDVDHVAAILGELKQLGVRIALDDFGTGYSSLSYLKRFPFDVLKIDRAFVRDVITNSDDAALCEAIIAMAQRLKLKVIAEGVETEEQYIYLCSRGADLLQGYYFGKGLAGSEFRAQLASLIP